MKWITRANVKVDRVACPWLICTFIDKEAEFLFPRRAGRERCRQDRCDPLRHVGRGTRAPRRRMLVRRHREEIQDQRPGDRPSGENRARRRHSAARSHAGIARPGGDRRRLQAAGRRARLRRPRNHQPRAASLRRALSLLRRRLPEAAAGLSDFGPSADRSLDLAGVADGTR